MRFYAKPLMVAVAAMLASPQIVHAQSGGATETSARGTLETVTITARKRKEELQKTPVAVSAFNEGTIENLFANNISEFSKYVPNVVMSNNQYTGGGLNMSIRGVSFADLEKTFEPSLGIYMDGVVFATNTGAMVDAFDMESIEILRGPQGTLFGRNTVGGVISMRRTRPTGEWGAKLGIKTGSYNRLDLRAVVNMPIVEDKLAFKLAYYRNSGDSHTTNFFTQKRDKGQDQHWIYGTFLLTPSDDFEMITTFDYLKDDSQYSAALNLTTPSGFTPEGAPIIANICDFGIYGILGAPLGDALCKSASFDAAAADGFKTSFNDPDIPHVNHLETFSIYNEINWDLGDVTLQAITGYKDTSDLLDEEGVGAPGFAVFHYIRPQTSDQFTQEITLSSNNDGRFNYVVGAYYFNSSYSMNTSQAFFFGQLSGSFNASQSSKAYAVFGETYFDITDKLSLTAGMRWTKDEKKFVMDNLVPNPFYTELQDSWDKLTWRLSLDYQITDETMVYFSYNRGYRSGGFNGRGTEPDALGPYNPETVDAYEVGIRSDLFNERVRVNLTAYRMKYKNKQEEVISLAQDGVNTVTSVANAASLLLQGFEAEMTAIVTDNFSIRSAASFLDSNYSSFFAPNPFYVPGSDDPFTRDQFIDNSDSAVRWAPKWTFSVAANYVIPVGNGGEVILNGNYAYKSKIQTSPIIDPLGRSTANATNVIDFAIIYDGPIGNTELRASAFVKDAFQDDNRAGTGVDAAIFFFGLTSPGRTWGIELEAAF